MSGENIYDIGEERVNFFAAQSSFPHSPGPSPDVHLATLAQRVKEVLPHVPLGVIQRDLGMRKSSFTQGDRHREGKWVVKGEGEQRNRLCCPLLPSPQPGLAV